MPNVEEVTEVIDETTAAPASDANTQTLPEDESKNPPDPSAQSEEAVSDSEDEDPKKPGRGVPQWRVDEITRERRSLERHNDELRRENETLKAQSGKSSPAQPQVQLPPHLASFNAFVAANPQFNTDVLEGEKQFLAARDQHTHQSWKSNWEQERTAQELKAKLDADVKAIPEAKEVKHVLDTFDKDVAAHINFVAQHLPNGAEVLKEALLKPELLGQLRAFERMRNGVGINAALSFISTQLLRESMAAKADGKELSADSRAPKPPNPVRQTRSSYSGEPPDSAPDADWQRWRREDLKRKGKG